MINPKMPMEKKEAVKQMIEKIHAFIRRWKEAEAEVVVGLIELEKIEAHKAIEQYATFAELLEGEFNWTELKFRSAKEMMSLYGFDLYKEYGREVLQAITRLETEPAKAKIFDRINEYKLAKGGKSPTYNVVAGWIREQVGKVREVGTPERVVNIKAKYIKTLEENKVLRQRIDVLETEIARLNRLLQNLPKAQRLMEKREKSKWVPNRARA